MSSAKVACVEAVDVFQDPLLENPPVRSAPVSVRRRYRTLTEQARRLCDDCPVRAACLDRAVSEVDVTGFVGGTTEEERLLLRQRFQITVAVESFDETAGLRRTSVRVDPAVVERSRRESPQASLAELARNLGCSLSTVKRHLRRHHQRSLGG